MTDGRPTGALPDGSDPWAVPAAADAPSAPPTGQAPPPWNPAWGAPAPAPPAWGAPAPAPPAWGAPAAAPPAWGAPAAAPPAWGAPAAAPPSGALAYYPPPPSWGSPQPAWAPAYPGSYNAAPNGQPTNPWAVVALVTGVLPLPPVAIGAGITALVQIRKRQQRGKGMAIGGLLAAVGWIVFGLIGVVAFLSWEAGLDGVGPVAHAGSTTVGSCLREAGEHQASTVISCNKAHHFEVYHVAELASGFPGTGIAGIEADGICQAAFKGYVGRTYEFSDYDYDFYLPSPAEAAAGENRVVCLVTPMWGQRTLNKSVRDIDR